MLLHHTHYKKPPAYLLAQALIITNTNYTQTPNQTIDTNSFSPYHQHKAELRGETRSHKQGLASVVKE